MEEEAVHRKHSALTAAVTTRGSEGRALQDPPNFQDGAQGTEGSTQAD